MPQLQTFATLVFFFPLIEISKLDCQKWHTYYTPEQCRVQLFSQVIKSSYLSVIFLYCLPERGEQLEILVAKIMPFQTSPYFQLRCGKDKRFHRIQLLVYQFPSHWQEDNISVATYTNCLHGKIIFGKYFMYFQLLSM